MTSDNLSRYFLRGLSCLCLLVLLYKLRDLGHDLTWRDILLYYAAPALLVALTWALSAAPAVLRAQLSLSLLAVGVAVLAADVYLTLTTSPAYATRQQSLIAAWRENGIDYDPRSVLEVVRAERAAGADVYPKLNPSTVLLPAEGGIHRSALQWEHGELVPVGTISNTRSVYCNESGTYLIYDSDEYGFHNPKQIWQQPRLAVTLVGDSFAEGACVPSDSNMQAVIRERHPATASVGMGGNGPLLALASLTEYLAPKRPEVVVWFFLEANDIRDMQKEAQSPLLRRYLEDGFSQDLARQQAAVDQAIRRYMDARLAESGPSPARQMLDVLDILLLRRLRQELSATLFGDGPGYSPRDLALLRRILSTAKTRVEGWGGRLVFVYLPVYATVTATTNGAASGLRDDVLAIARELALTVVDPTPALAAQPDAGAIYPLPGISHFNENGYRVVATEVLKTLAGMAD